MALINTSVKLFYGYTPLASGLMFCRRVLQLSNGRVDIDDNKPDKLAAVMFVAYQPYPKAFIDSRI